MAQLSRLTSDRTAMQEGEWITVGSGDDTFKLRVRGFTTAYRDALATLRRQAARKLNRTVQAGEAAYDPGNLPPSVDDACQGQALAEHCVLDVAGLDDGSTAVTVDAFRDFLRDPAGRAGLLILTIQAASRVGIDRKEQADAAAGN